FIKGDYLNLLGRSPSSSELTKWVDRMQAGSTDSQLTTGFLASNEYYRDHGKDSTRWLTGLYQDVLHHPPDAAGLAGWENALDNGSTRRAVAFAFVHSTEAQGLVVTGDYQKLLQRAPDQTEMGSWTAALHHGMTNSQLLSTVAGTPEYAQLQMTPGMAAP